MGKDRIENILGMSVHRGSIYGGDATNSHSRSSKKGDFLASFRTTKQFGELIVYMMKNHNTITKEKRDRWGISYYTSFVTVRIKDDTAEFSQGGSVPEGKFKDSINYSEVKKHTMTLPIIYKLASTTFKAQMKGESWDNW